MCHLVYSSITCQRNQSVLVDLHESLLEHPESLGGDRVRAVDHGAVNVTRDSVHLLTDRARPGAVGQGPGIKSIFDEIRRACKNPFLDRSGNFETIRNGERILCRYPNFPNFRASKPGDHHISCWSCTNDVRRILKLQSCERVGRDWNVDWRNISW